MLACVSFQYIFDLVLFSCLPYNYYKLTTVVDRYKCLKSCQEDGACASVAFKLDISTCYFFNEKLVSTTSSSHVLEGSFIAYNTRRSSVDTPLKDCPLAKGYNYDSTIKVCYKYYNDTASNDQAKDRCKQDGAKGLVRVDTPEKLNYFKTLMPAFDTWVIIAGKFISGSWTYEQENVYDCQTYMPFLNWSAGQGSGGSRQPCMALGPDAMYDGSCSIMGHSICEM